MKSFLLILILMGVATCTSLSKEDCANMHWSSKGREDAYQGKTLAELGKYQKQCNKHAVTIDKENYYDGFNEGLKTFCTEERANSFGRSGGVYQGQCPTHLEKNFIKPYELAYREYKIEKKEKELEERQEELNSQALEARNRSEAVAILTGKSCSFDSDCTLEDSCDFKRCRRSSLQCTFNSDCDLEGDCRFSRCVYP